jgi:ATP phosphoribosyltransferase regulatory subunit
MAAEEARRYEALESQAARIMAVFSREGYEHVAPSIIQPADVFLDRVGEAIRNRMYVFADPEGRELCLRPDLTIPVSRLYLERGAPADAVVRYAYNGPAFRYQPGKPDANRPREFRQAGVECFNAADREACDAEILALIIEAVRAAGLKRFVLRLGDLGLFNALLAALPMPDRWRDRLSHRFWRPLAFHELLHRLAGESRPSREPSVAALIASLAPDPEKAAAQTAAYLENAGVVQIGVRSLDEIVERITHEAADIKEKPLSSDIVRLIESYLAITGAPKAALAQARDLAAAAGVDLRDAIEASERRLRLISAAGVDAHKAVFSADFGREFEYYTGFVFQIDAPGEGGLPVAGGGRYDGLLRAIGARVDAPAAGSAIHTERLLAAVDGEKP